MKEVVGKDDFVTVVYEGFLSDGEIFESSKDTGPMQFQMGSAAVLPGFENKVLGMKLNETKTFKLTPDEGFGSQKPELVHTMDKNTLGISEGIKPGIVLGLTMEKEGEKVKVPALITEVNGTQITVDFNHPLAGQTLRYQVTVTAIDDQPETTAPDCNCGCGSSSVDKGGDAESGCKR